MLPPSGSTAQFDFVIIFPPRLVLSSFAESTEEGHTPAEEDCTFIEVGWTPTEANSADHGGENTGSSNIYFFQRFFQCPDFSNFQDFLRFNIEGFNQIEVKHPVYFLNRSSRFQEVF